jgi:hypothetical protein
MKKKIFIFILFSIFMSSCTLYRQVVYNECSYDEIENIDSTIRYTINNINEIDKINSENFYDDGVQYIHYSSKSMLNKYFSNQNYELCLHRVYKIDCDSNYIYRGNIIYRSLNSKRLLQVELFHPFCDSKRALFFYFTIGNNCKFWEWKIESPFY